MNKQTIEFAVQRTDNIVTRIGRSYISHPEIKFSGGHIKWYEDKPNQQCSNKNEWVAFAVVVFCTSNWFKLCLYNKETIQSNQWINGLVKAQIVIV